MAHGSHVWYELSTTDLSSATAFYSKTVGWEVRDSGMPDMDYHLFYAQGGQVAGAMNQPAEVRVMGVPPMWTGYVGVDSVDASAEKARSLGGSIHHQPMDIPGIGRFAVVADPHGAVFALFSSDSEPPSFPNPMAPGLFGWNELYAGNLDEALAFYSALFGWTKGEAMDMGDKGIYQIIMHGGMMIGGMMKKPEMIPVPSWLYYVNVSSVTAAVKIIEELGGKVMNGPMEVPGGAHIVQALDPQGAAFAVSGPLA
jgi:predicted enzyme related to lactoylglutathione lyase